MNESVREVKQVNFSEFNQFKFGCDFGDSRIASEHFKQIGVVQSDNGLMNSFAGVNCLIVFCFRKVDIKVMEGLYNWRVHHP